MCNRVEKVCMGGGGRETDMGKGIYIERRARLWRVSPERELRPRRYSSSEVDTRGCLSVQRSWSPGRRTLLRDLIPGNLGRV